MSEVTVLMLGNDRARLELLADLLPDDHKSLLANGERDALETVAEGRCDVVVQDLVAGSEGAFAFLTKVRELPDSKAAQTPIIVSAGRDRPVDRLRGWEAGCDAWLARPHFVAEVTDAIKASLERPPAKRDDYRKSQLAEVRRAVAEERRR